MAHLLRPFTHAEIETNLDVDGFISGRVAVALKNIVDDDLESFLDRLSEKLIGNDLLMNISYKVVGVTDKSEVVIEVTGDPSMALELRE